MGTCGVCSGSGICQNAFHGESFVGTIVKGLLRVVDPHEECPECGNLTVDPGKCGTCGGTGET